MARRRLRRRLKQSPTLVYAANFWPFRLGSSAPSAKAQAEPNPSIRGKLLAVPSWLVGASGAGNLRKSPEYFLSPKKFWYLEKFSRFFAKFLQVPKSFRTCKIFREIWRKFYKSEKIFELRKFFADFRRTQTLVYTTNFWPIGLGIFFLADRSWALSRLSSTCRPFPYYCWKGLGETNLMVPSLSRQRLPGSR